MARGTPLARHWPGGREAFIAAMNGKAELLGMTQTHFADSSGLNPRNVSTARDLAKLLEAVLDYDYQQSQGPVSL